ncbi:hypothetical protein JKF63_01634 [Porcisia hertigi]|uniref:Conserved oligomeric Golgi complex subunit 6 n=1 Tax=Porcisia hertigi TaxID=2761500 RepID=A0A836HWJ7_9TRYP|nr:hypothetical protein JKF63_01634 [Porcisia hertigi]
MSQSSSLCGGGGTGPSSLQAASTQPPSAVLEKRSADTICPTPTAPPLSAASTSAKNSATQRKVAKLLDIKSSSDIKDLASYVDNILPGYFYCLGDSDKDDYSSVEASTTINRSPPPVSSTAASSCVKSTTSTALRSALDRRTIDVHKRFLKEFTAVYESYRRVAAQVNELESKCSSLEKTMNTTEGRHSKEVENFFYQIHIHQAELQMVQSHEKEVEEFRKHHDFGPDEQRILEEGPVDMTFLKVLERARQVHQRSNDLMQSLEYHQGAATVMESTHGAIARATEKIARHLLATAGVVGSRDLGVVTVSAAAGGFGSIAGDVPEVTGFQLQCVRLLYEENPLLHDKFLDEVARLRRASVLRRYFHLLTTGSANTSTSLYQSGGQPSVHDDDAGSKPGRDEAGMGTRPLEAELNNPTYFFSSLCAWLHQTIVEEQDFLHNFFVSDELGVGRERQRAQATTTVTPFASVSTQGGSETTRPAREMERQQALLDNVFEGVCKHVRAALDNVLERLGRTGAALGAVAGGLGGGDGGGGRGNTAHVDSTGSLAPPKGSRSLTRGLSRLFTAATGRSLAAAFRGSGQEEAHTLPQRYAGVTTRAQQEAAASSVLNAPLQAIQACVTLVALFEYYSATTFKPLLGGGSALTRLIREVAPEQTRELFQRLLRVLSTHLLDSTAGIISRTATLRRLASSDALKHAANPGDAQSASPLPGECSADTRTDPPSTYVLDFLVAFTYGSDANEGGTLSMESESALPHDSEIGMAMSSSTIPAAATTTRFRQANDGQLQRRSAHDLQRVLSQLILPPSPEITAYCAVVHSVLRDTARQAELLGAIAEQQHAGVAQGYSSTDQTADSNPGAAPLATHTLVTSFVLELLQSLLKTAHSVEADGPLRMHLDDPCRAIVEYNVLYQLRSLLEQHATVLGALFSGSSPEDQEAKRALECIQTECVTTMAALRQRLLSAWAHAVKLFYFPVSTEAVVSAFSGSAAAEADEQRLMTLKKDVRRVLKQFVNVYNTVASLGRLPEPVPLLLALSGSDDVCEEVRKNVTLSIVEGVYPAEFKVLLSLPPTEEVIAVRTEMAPQNLISLVDLSSTAPATAV